MDSRIAEESVIIPEKPLSSGFGVIAPVFGNRKWAF
jgi:hypothetical protein